MEIKGWRLWPGFVFSTAFGNQNTFYPTIQKGDGKRWVRFKKILNSELTLKT
jgi:hypothetical protein